MTFPKASPLWYQLWSAGDGAVVDAGAAGEVLVARIRLLLAGLLVLIPLRSTWEAPWARENYVGLGAALVAVALAVAIYLLARRGFHPPWFGFATSVVDVSLVSLALSSFLLLGTPHTAVNSKVVFEVYFIAIGATCLRYDRRICMVAGLLAMLQYAAIVSYADFRWELNDPSFAPFTYGAFSWTAQISRLFLLFTATVLSTTIVIRAQRLQHLSTHDRLTGLLNRGYFDDRAIEEVSRARRYAHPLSVALIDLDEFKRFNDVYGHATGDAALRAVATTLRDSLRRSDIIARYGGEEFVLLLPETNADDAVEKLEAIRGRVAEMVLATPRQSLPLRLTIGAGVASWPADGPELDDLLYQADTRLFQAKRGGRNQVVGASGASSDAGTGTREHGSADEPPAPLSHTPAARARRPASPPARLTSRRPLRISEGGTELGDAPLDKRDQLPHRLGVED